MDKQVQTLFILLNLLVTDWEQKLLQFNCQSEQKKNFTGIIDLVEMKAYHFDGKAEEIATEIEIPAELKAQAEELRAQLVEAVVEYDEELMIKFLDGEELTIPEIKSAIRKDAVIDYLPSPLDVPSIKGILEDGTESERHPSDTEPFSALAFKVMTDPFVGKLTFFRVYSGILEKGSYVTNTTKDKKERIGRILQMHANNRSEIEIVYAGDIAAAVGLKRYKTGDTLSDDNIQSSWKEWYSQNQLFNWL
ncbi:hypothetical protein FQA39_LY12780 [Lamprigera yunnana]|nr:hypothetical protein FQA39_LY12780 [Lamprigera yunnana]